MTTRDRILQIAEQLLQLTPFQLTLIESIITQLAGPHTFNRLAASDLITDDVLAYLGDALRIHHALSRETLSKDRFEYALERALNMAGRNAQLSRRGHPGHDLTLDGVPISLKTQSDAGIKEDSLHISKFMELGKGDWILPLLRDRFLAHMANYERILQLRCLKQGPHIYLYELVEIPKPLLEEATTAQLVVAQASRQNPKPGYGHVYDSEGQIKFSLYFDGGTERKLQIKAIRKVLCTRHAIWEFSSTPLT